MKAISPSTNWVEFG